MMRLFNDVKLNKWREEIKKSVDEILSIEDEDLGLYEASLLSKKSKTLKGKILLVVIS